MAVNATQTLTYTGASVNAQTVTVGGKVYTHATAYANTDGLVVVGATAAAAAQNVCDAINNTPSALGVTVGAVNTLNAQVRCISTPAQIAAGLVVVQAKLAGTIGNLVVSTETDTNSSWGAATLAGGTGDLAVELAAALSMMQMPASVMQLLKDTTGDPAAG